MNLWCRNGVRRFAEMGSELRVSHRPQLRRTSADGYAKYRASNCGSDCGQ